ncbi:MAG TPA: lycopene beta-cyclase CrtY [Polyangiaceae bacterium]
MARIDYLLVGGGLQNALVAAALAERRPGARVVLIESSERTGGNHLWCFHALDVPEPCVPFVEPLVVRRWPKYRVRFPTYARTLEEPYAAVSSGSVHEHLTRLAGDGRLELMLGRVARRVEPGRVELASGEKLDAGVVVDARGPERFAETAAIGYQKFFGLELEAAPETVPAEPMLMDCSVEQLDGLRFVYVLPLARDRVLVEDTYFSDGPELDVAALEGRITSYAEKTGLAVRRVLRTERGVLPLPASAPVSTKQSAGLVRAGYQGGWFHPTTGYSFPLAVRVAAVVATASEQELPDRLAELATRTARQQRFASLLNRMLFRAFRPELRYVAFERFYRLPPETVRRFYALSLTSSDRARIVCGRPPRGLSPRGLLSALAAGSRVINPHPRTNP